MKNHKGQATVELVLIMVALLAVTFFIRKQLITDKNFFVAFISTPWQQIGGMVESGHWGKRADVRQHHPTQFQRMYSTKGD